MKVVIFVDDDKNLTDSLKRSFRSCEKSIDMNFEYNPLKALNFVNTHDVDLIVTDYKMPEMNGVDLLREIKKKKPLIKSIILSGQSENEVYEEAKDIADAYLTKPCDFDELKAKMITLL